MIRPRPGSRQRAASFTLVEVLIAMAVFFLCIFSLLALTTTNLQAARALQVGGPTLGSLASELCSVTNRLEEGVEEGDFGDAYPGYTWRREVLEVQTNGLFQANFWIYKQRQSISDGPGMSILLYRPESMPGGRR